MKKNTPIIILCSIVFFGVLVVFILYANTSEKTNHQYNSFQRTFLPKTVDLSSTLDVKYNSYYIAGANANHLYFGNVAGSRHLLLTDLNLADTQHVELKIQGLEGLKFRSIRVQVDSPYFYWSDGSVPAIFRGTLMDWQASRYTYDSAYFMDVIPISSSSFLLRTTSRQSKEFVLGKEANNPPYIQLAPNLLEKQIDGKFCVDGMMHYSKHLNWLVYVYFYRNQFICADSSLNLIYRGNTIDTVSQAKIKVEEIKSDRSLTMAAPPIMVNKKSCVSGGQLFINSNLLAKNEKKEIFEQSSVIDVYDLKNGKYLHSFYLPKHNGMKMREFQVFDDLLIVLYDHYIVKYQLNPDYISS